MDGYMVGLLAHFGRSFSFLKSQKGNGYQWDASEIWALVLGGYGWLRESVASCI